MALDTMFNEHQPEFWIFGHYHTRKSFVENGTKFEALGYAHNTNRKNFKFFCTFELKNLTWT